jgi:hypothetical protein
MIDQSEILSRSQVQFFTYYWYLAQNSLQKCLAKETENSYWYLSNLLKTELYWINFTNTLQKFNLHTYFPAVEILEN